MDLSHTCALHGGIMSEVCEKLGHPSHDYDELLSTGMMGHLTMKAPQYWDAGSLDYESSSVLGCWVTHPMTMKSSSVLG